MTNRKIKVTLLGSIENNEASNQIEIRRFDVPPGQTGQKEGAYLKLEFQSLFQIKSKFDGRTGMKVFWQDKDLDYIRIVSDEEMKNGIKKLFVVAER